jgi:hypothetical protein
MKRHLGRNVPGDRLRRPAAKPSLPRRRRNWFEELEFRTLLATVSWAVDRDGFWDVPGNWSTGSVPLSGDDVILDRPGADVTVTLRSGTATVNVLTSQESLVVTGGTLSVGRDSTVRELSIANGTVTGAGGVSIGETLNWTGGNLIGSGKTVIAATAEFNYSAGTRTTTRGFELTGPASILSGSLGLDGDGFIAGRVNLATASELVVMANINLRRPAEVTGAGVLRIGGSATGVLSVEDEVAVERVSLRTFGTVAGPKALQIGQHFDWQGGSIDATATVVTESQATLLISTGAGHTLDGQLTVQGGGQWTGGGIGLGGTLLIEPGGVFEIVVDQTISTRSGPSQVVNQGTLRKTTTAGLTTFSGTTAFVHSGTVEVQTGTLYLDGAVSSSGPMVIAAGAFIDVAGTTTLQAGAHVRGQGALRVGGSATGEVVASAAIEIDRLALRLFGTISGPQPITVLDHFEWQAGSINANATLVTEPEATLLISTGSSHTLDGHLTVRGSGQWTGGGIALGGTLLVEPGGVFRSRSIKRSRRDLVRRRL